MIGISYIVPVLNGEKTIQACIESILAQRVPCSRELIVVDNGSSDGTMKRLQEFPGISVVKELTKGRSRARNSGARLARFPFLAFIDCDVILSPDWSNQLMQVNQKPFGAVQTPLVVKSSQREKEFYYLNAFSPFQTIDSAAMMISKEIFFEVGGFSEEFLYWEDSELTMRLMNHGYSLMVVAPSLAVKHQTSCLWRLCLRAFMVGFYSGKAMKAWSGKGQAKLRDFVVSVAKKRPPTEVFQILGHVFSWAPLRSVMQKKKGWLQIEKDLVISRQLITLVAPHFISLRTLDSRVHFTCKNDHPQFERLLKKAYKGRPVFEELIELSQSAEFNSLIIRRSSV